MYPARLPANQPSRPPACSSCPAPLSPSLLPSFMASISSFVSVPNLPSRKCTSSASSSPPFKISLLKGRLPKLVQPRCVGKDENLLQSGGESFDRRKLLLFSTIGFLSGSLQQLAKDGTAVAVEFADMPAIRGKDYGKTKMRYPDYTETKSGLQYKDLRVGIGPTPKIGETVVVDWDGYTIGYYGRIFEARNKTKGGSFEGDDKDFFKFTLGSNQVIPAFEEAVVGMTPGSVRRIIVPPELGYPDNDFNKLGPRPTTFSGQRALDFVLRNQGLIDKTLLFDIELLKIISS